VIKNGWLAQRLGGDLYSVVFKYEQGNMNSVWNEAGLLYGMLVWFEGVYYDRGDDETGKNNICDVNDDDDDDDDDDDHEADNDDDDDNDERDHDDDVDDNVCDANNDDGDDGDDEDHDNDDDDDHFPKIICSCRLKCSNQGPT